MDMEEKIFVNLMEVIDSHVKSAEESEGLVKTLAYHIAREITSGNLSGANSQIEELCSSHWLFDNSLYLQRLLLESALKRSA